MEIDGARALVTGGASGIGYALAERFLTAGARVVIVDIDEAAAAAAAERLASSTGVGAEFTSADVSDPASMAAVGAFVRDRFGGLDLLCNNAGVAFNSKPLWETPPEMVDWSFGVNTIGVINGIREFVPGMIEQRHGYVVNTASTAGFHVRGGVEWFQGLYAATKFGVVAISEALRADLAPYGIGVSILAPSAVNTNIGRSDRVRPARFGGPTTGSSPESNIRGLVERGMAPALVAELVAAGIEHERMYVFPHPNVRDVVAERQARILAGFDETAAELERARIQAEPDPDPVRPTKQGATCPPTIP